MLVRGNRKLDKSILTFSLPPVVTCLNSEICRKWCYALDIYRNPFRSPRTVWDANYYLALHFPNRWYHTMLSELDTAKEKVVRIHVGGDFFNQHYIKMWIRLAQNFPKKQFYGFSKVFHIFPNTLADFNSLPNVNIINSILPDGSLNFGTIGEVLYKQEKFGFPICEYSAHHPHEKCGVTCNRCLTAKGVLFVKHGREIKEHEIPEDKEQLKLW